MNNTRKAEGYTFDTIACHLETSYTTIHTFANGNRILGKNGKAEYTIFEDCILCHKTGKMTIRE